MPTHQPNRTTGGDPPAASKIRVIEVRRHIVDPAKASPEELKLAIEAVSETAALESVRISMEAFEGLGDFLRGPLAPFLAEDPLAAKPAPSAAPLDAVTVRTLLANPAVRPIISARGAAATSERSAARRGAAEILTRPATRVRGVAAEGGRDLGLAAEEPIVVTGFAVDPGTACLSAGDRRWFMGLDAMAASGAYTAAAFASHGDGRFPEYFGRPPRKGALAVQSESPSRLVQQTAAALSYYLGGAAAAVVAAHLNAARRGDPGASPAMAVALTPSRSILNWVVKAPAEAPAEAGSAKPTWRDALTASRLRYLMERLSRAETVAAADPAEWAYDMNPLNDLFRVGALSVYLFAITEGRESERLDEFLARSSVLFTRQVQLGKLARAATAATARARAYMTIVEDKFGTARSNEVLDSLRTAVGARNRAAPGGSLAQLSDSVQVDDPAAVVAALTKRERAVVETEYENRRKQWEASVANRCPHVLAARRLRTAATAEEANEALRQLEAYFAPDRLSAGDSWLMCRSCGFRALCPHVRDRVRMEARRTPYAEIRTRLLKYAVRGSPTDTDFHTYFCRICSEKLAEIFEDADASEAGRFGTLDSGLRTKIWVVAIGVARDVRFPMPTDERRFASAAAAAVYPHLMATEEAASKGRRRKEATEADDEIDPRTQLYIVLFVYAYVLDLVQSTQGAKSQEVGFAGVKLGARASSYAESMLRAIAEKHRGVIEQIENISEEFIKSRFVEAYRAVRSDGPASLHPTSPEEELAVQTTSIDPIYRYAGVAARVAGAIPSGFSVGPAGMRREFETILGAGIPAIVKLARESSKDPALAPLYLRRTGLEVPFGSSLEFLVKDPRVNLYARMYEPPAGEEGEEARRAFLDFSAGEPGNRNPASGIHQWIGGEEGISQFIRWGGRDRGRERGRNAPPQPTKERPTPKFRTPVGKYAMAERGEFFAAYRLFAEYTKRITSPEAQEAYANSLAAYKLCEDGLRMAKATEAVKTYYDFKFARSQQYVHAVAPITSVYDEDGAKHDWGKGATYFYTGADGTEVSFRGAAAVAAARGSGALLPTMTLADIACPVCGLKKSEIGRLDIEKTERSVRATFEIGSLFLFYESRCPSSAAGGLHRWSGADQRCSACGITADILKAAAAGEAAKNTDARNYYDRHLAAFNKARGELRAQAPAVQNAKPVADSPVSEEATSWQPDYTIIVRAAKLAGVTPATIEAIGSTEGREYADIIEGKGVPPLPSAPSDPRILTADAETRLFLADYGQLRSAGRRAPSEKILAVLEAAGVPKHEYGTLAVIMPDVGRGYRDTFQAILRERTPADAYTFAIQSLCRMAVEVASPAPGRPPWAAVLGAEFSKRELAVILRSQKLFSKPGNFNWAIFEADDDADTPQDQVGDVGEDVLQEIMSRSGEEAPEDPFSGENMDYDTSEDNPNNEPD
jgi:hypothetical protein